MDSDEDWENHEVGSLGVLVLGVLVRFLRCALFQTGCTQFSNSSVHLENCCFWEHFRASTHPGEECRWLKGDALVAGGGLVHLGQAEERVVAGVLAAAAARRVGDHGQALVNEPHDIKLCSVHTFTKFIHTE